MSIKKSGYTLNKRSISSWCFYDWANTAFGTVIITFIFGVYFSRQIVGDETEGSAMWSFAIAISGLIVAVLAPILGAAADQIGRRKPWIFAFSLLCVVPTALLWFVSPEVGAEIILPTLVLVALANVGYELAQVFYNAMLPDVAPKEKIGRVSGWAWGLGYVGGLVALAISLFVFIGLGDAKPLLDLPRDNFEHIRITAPFIALWFLLFMAPLFIFTPDRKLQSIGFVTAVKTGAKNLWHDLKNARQQKNLMLFLISSAIYRDGLVTLFAIGGVYAAGQFGMSFTEILIFAIGLNVTAGVGAFAFAFFDDARGSKNTIMISLIGLIVIGGIILFIQDKYAFIILSMGLGIFIGPVQAASRTMVGKLCPPEGIGQSYGLYAFTGKSISFFGPLAFGLMTTAFGSQQAGMASIIAFWLVGLLILLKVKEQNA